MQSEFDTVRKGYDKGQVDEYIEYLQNTIEEYAKNENQVKVLIQQAEQKADILIREAEVEASNIIDGAYSKLHSIQDTIKDQRKLLDNFRRDYNRFILKYVNEVNKRDFVYLVKSVDEMENYIEDTIKSAEQVRNGYFVPNAHTDSPILIVEPNYEDFNLPSSKLDTLDNSSELEYNDVTAEDLLDLTGKETFAKHLDKKETTIELAEIQEALLRLKTDEEYRNELLL